MGSKYKFLSIETRQNLHEEFKEYCGKKDIAISACINNLVEQALKVDVNQELLVIGKPVDADVTPVTLKIPTVLKNDPEVLRQWLELQVNGIVKALTKNSLDKKE